MAFLLSISEFTLASLPSLAGAAVAARKQMGSAGLRQPAADS
ncbi:hypothetical protein [Hydrogenophaga palleronii]|nr:hypothetical protein [Hydrogenophaga palleronii]